MPYDLVHVRNAGDCFFDSVARHLNREGIGDPPDGFYWDASSVRQAMMDHVMRDLFGNVHGEARLDDFLELWIGPQSTLAGLLPFGFSGLSYDVIPWWGHEWGEERKRPFLAALFVWWCRMSEQTPDRTAVIASASEWLQSSHMPPLLADHLVWGACGRDAFYEAILRQLWHLEVETTQGELAYPDRRREGTLVLLCNGNHYQPYLWRSDDFSFLPDFVLPSSVCSQGAANNAPPQAIARHDDNTLAKGVRLGLGVWNLNHLGEESKGQKREREEAGDAGAPDSSPTGPAHKKRRVMSQPPPAEPQERDSRKRKRPVVEPAEPQEDGDELAEPLGDAEEGDEGERTERKKPRTAGPDNDPGPPEDDPPAGPGKTNTAASKIRAVGELIDRNRGWLDVLALNEVNKGVDLLEDVAGCALYKGPHLVSVGQKLGTGQHEYYPLLVVNRDGGPKITYRRCSVFFSTGRKSFKWVDHGQEIKWIKKDNLKKAGSDASYRDAIVAAATKLIHLIKAMFGQAEAKAPASGKKRAKKAAPGPAETGEALGGLLKIMLAASYVRGQPNRKSAKQRAAPSKSVYRAASLVIEARRKSLCAAVKATLALLEASAPTAEAPAEKVDVTEILAAIHESLQAAIDCEDPEEGKLLAGVKGELGPWKKRIATVQTAFSRLDPKGRKDVIDDVELNIYRPVVIHHLLVGARQLVNVGIVHTTPGGTEFERKMVYEQLEKLFEEVGNGWAPDDGAEALWLVAGDFYLFGEAVTGSEKASYQMRSVRDLQEAGDKIPKDVMAEAGATEELIDTRFAAQAKALREEIALIDAQLEAIDAKLRAAGGRSPDGRQASPPGAPQDAPVEDPDDLAVLQARGQALCGEAISIQIARLHELRDKLGKATTKWDAEKDRLSIWQVEGDIGKSRSGLIFLERLKAYEVGKQRLRDERQSEIGPLLGGMAATLKKGFGAEPSLKDRIEDFESRVKKRKLVADDEAAGAAPGAGAGVERDEYLGAQSYFARNVLLSARADQRMRKALGLTFAAQVEDHFHIYQTIWATNIHSRAKVDGSGIEYTAFRIADFVVSSKRWRSAELGVFHHSAAGLVRVEDEEHDKEDGAVLPTTVYWRQISDHFPVGGVFSTRAHDLAVKRVFVDVLYEDFFEAKRWAMALWHLIDACQVLGGSMPPPGYDMEAWLEKEPPARYELLASEIARLLGDAPAAASIQDDLMQLAVRPAPDPAAVFKKLNGVLASVSPQLVESSDFPFFADEPEEEADDGLDDGEGEELVDDDQGEELVDDGQSADGLLGAQDVEMERVDEELGNGDGKENGS